MVDWRSPEVLRRCFNSLADIVSITLGLFIWYLCTTFDLVEMRLLTGRLKFSPMTHIPYLLGRYSFLISTASFVALMHWYSSADLHCEGVMVFMVIFGDICLVTSSMNMMNRLRAIWNGNKTVYGVMVLFTLGHLALAIMIPITNVHVYWDPVERMCQETHEYNETSMFAFYLYTSIWDCLILILTIWGLRRQTHEWNSPLVWNIRYQGAVYIVCTFITNTIVMVFALEDLNIIMDIVLAVPGGAVNVMLSSFMMTVLMDGKEDTPESIPASTSRERDAKQIASTASTIVDLTDAYWQRTSSETQDGRYGDRNLEIRVETPSSLGDDLSCTCYSSDNPVCAV